MYYTRNISSDKFLCYFYTILWDSFWKTYPFSDSMICPHSSCDVGLHSIALAVPAAQGLLLILKWGGELTAAGQRQAEELGRAFRCMYPGGEGEYASLPGSGFLRLHSTYRHDLKVYASDEGRVQMTAAAFTKVSVRLWSESLHWQ